MLPHSFCCCAITFLRLPQCHYLPKQADRKTYRQSREPGKQPDSPANTALSTALFCIVQSVCVAIHPSSRPVASVSCPFHPLCTPPPYIPALAFVINPIFILCAVLSAYLF